MDKAPKKADWRQMTAAEREIIDLLLNQTFPGREELREQVNHCLVRVLDEHGCL